MARLESWGFENMKYLFIAITPKSTLTQNDSTCVGPINGQIVILSNTNNSTYFKNTLYTYQQYLMMAYEISESAQDNFGKFPHQFQPKTKTLIRKLERILIKLYRQNVSLSFNQTCLNKKVLLEYTLSLSLSLSLYIYIYICVCVCVCVRGFANRYTIELNDLTINYYLFYLFKVQDIAFYIFKRYFSGEINSFYQF